MCLGISIGAPVDAATNNVCLWISIGLCIGVALGLAFSSSEKKIKNKGVIR